MTASTVYFARFAPRPPPPVQIDPHIAHVVIVTVLFAVSFLNYLIFSYVTVYGIKVAYRLRHGEARYADNYKAEIQKRIERLRKKFPNL